MPSLWKQSGSSQPGVDVACFSLRNSTSSPLTAWFSGAPRAFQSGKSSFIARGSITAPDSVCAPGSLPFSSTTTETSAFSCFRRMAVARPAGPPPTTTTSYSMASRGPYWARISAGVMSVSLAGDAVKAGRKNSAGF